MYKSDTICTIATGMGRSAIGMVRVSGPEAIDICDKIFRGKKRIKNMETFTAAFGRIVYEDEIFDEAVVLVMKAPHTYTTEDTVEINLHGGSYVIKRVMELLLNLGVRPAEPGEFTKRAFLGGRIDMTEAEAVMDVINAETDKALKASVGQLTGGLSKQVVELREKILYQTAYIESALDDPENYSLDGYSDKLKEVVITVKDKIEALLRTADEGRIIREGISTAIVGRPNVGKSSILNLLLGEERAIVTDIEGTTRDTLEEYVNIGGIILKLIDTAGIRNTDDVVEKIGVDRAKESIEEADLILMILDGSESLLPEDKEILESVRDKKIITLINKSDKESNLDKEELASIIDTEIIDISAKTGDGLEDLKDVLTDMFFRDELDFNDQIYITNSRHKAALISANESLGKVLESIDSAMGEDFYTIDLMAAYESLGDIIGETLEDDLADKIFSEFCMGK
ncbi:MAG: tRNA uridine-5-carboxymethylaminomethyl(34) synthesis GTPase MnmE [Eubacterium sp.]|nr:tRNA uridine-5-carboxymethylaminomethyl(34) synthesis GTPase MnmE [Eubacterium sp.]